MKLSEEEIKKSYISKEVIREKIEELENSYNISDDTVFTSGEMFIFVRDYTYKVKNILQELLK